jgi:phosphatidylglycerophosphate synthase
MSAAKPILLYWPNVIGYVRLALTVAAVALHTGADSLAQTLTLLLATTLLDHVDGKVARLLGETSRVGVFIDVVVDNVTRACTYVLAVAATDAVADARGARFTVLLACLLIAVEWITFASTHAASLIAKRHWKQAEIPAFMQAIFRDNFQTPLGVLVIGALNALPLWLLVHQPTHAGALDALRAWTAPLFVPLVLFRALGMCCELFFIARHVQELLQEKAE